MPLFSDDIDAARPTAPGPYAARSASDRTGDWPFWYVTNDGRRNVLSFPGSGGAVLTSRQVAEAIAAKWNATNQT